MLKYKPVNIVFFSLLVILLFWNWKYGAPFWVGALLIACYCIIQVYGSFIVSAQFFLPIRCRGSAGRGSIALTFDDGPLPGKTGKILSILQEQKIPAAFFCIGNRVRKNPELVRQIHDEGHIIGNHSFSHAPTFDLQSSGKMGRELVETDDEIQSVVGLRPHFFRPPFGVTNPNLARAIIKGGYITVGWSVRSLDTVIKDRQKLFKRVTRGLSSGDIVLFHDYCDSTIEILPDFLSHISKLGLKVVRLDEMLGEEAYQGTRDQGF